MEKVILRFKLRHIMNLDIVEIIVIQGYRETGNKFSVNFHGSKGYLNHIEICCEGKQKEGINEIYLHRGLYTKKRQLRSKLVSIYHSDENGVRVEI